MAWASEVLISHRRRLLIIAVAEGGNALVLGEKTVVAFNAASAAAHARSSSSERGSRAAYAAGAASFASKTI